MRLKRVLALLISLSLLLLCSCATVCTNGPQVKETLDAKILSVQIIVNTLNAIVPTERGSQFIEELTLARQTLATLQALFALNCPPADQVNAAVIKTDQDVIPKCQVAIKKAVRMGIIKPNNN